MIRLPLVTADIACRALVVLSPSVTKLQCPVRQVSARQVGPGHSSLALVSAHPRSDQGIGGLQSDARSHHWRASPAHTATPLTALTIP